VRDSTLKMPNRRKVLGVVSDPLTIPCLSAVVALSQSWGRYTSDLPIAPPPSGFHRFPLDTGLHP